jgi:hypothetical protein
VLDDLTAASFVPHIGRAFAVEGHGVLILEDVAEGGPAPGPGLRVPFTLRFSGAVTLDQQIHRLAHPTLGWLDIFLVRIGETTYEAVFA